MTRINENPEIITTRSLGNFKSFIQDPKLQESVWNFFFQADTMNEKGEEGRDLKLTGSELSMFKNLMDKELNEQFERWQKTCDITDVIRINDRNGNEVIYNKLNYNQAIKKINPENIEDIIFFFSQNRESFAERIKNPYFLANTNENFDKRDIKDIEADCKHIIKVIQKWCKERGIDTSHLDNKNILQNVKYEALNPDTNEIETYTQQEFDPEKILEQYINLITNYKSQNELKSIMTQDHSEAMQAAIDERYETAIQNNEILSLTFEEANKNDLLLDIYQMQESNVDTAKILYGENSEKYRTRLRKLQEYGTRLKDSGNGVFDKPALQLTGNCWLHAGINAFLATDFGTHFLETNVIKDNEKHIFAVYLEEAKNKGLPQPNGDGIYVFTEKEVLDIQDYKKGLSSGEGEVAALALAIEKLLETENPELKNDQEFYTDGNKGYRLFEILTGLKHDDNKENDMGLTHKNTYDKNYLLYNYEKIHETIQNERGAVVLGGDNHAFSVVGVEGEYLLIQESNLSDSFKDIFTLIENTFPPTYKISKEEYENYFNAYNMLKWE